MSVYIDTSAFLAVLNADDRHHPAARDHWVALLGGDETLICTNYVLVETCALIQARFGMAALRAFHDAVAPLLHIVWVDAATHRAGIAALLTADRRRLSLVDCISFETIRRLAISRVFAFDPHFAEQGFAVLS